MQQIAWLIDEAWEHRRRRLRRLALAALVAGAIAALVVIIAQGSGSTAATGSPAAPGPAVVQPSAVLSRSPYLGVSCPVADSIACDRVGLAVWLKRPAVSVTATIAGARLPLNRYGDRLARTRRPRRAFDGFLQPAGIVSRLHVRPVDGNQVSTRHGRPRVTVSRQMWFGAGSDPSPLVRLTIRDAGGRATITRLRVGLAAGWG